MDTGPERRQRAVADATRIARSLGLDAAGAHVIADANNTVVLLPAERLVAKVSTSTLEGRGPRSLERELRLGRHLAERGAPVAAPAPPQLAGPHETPSGRTATFWRYHDSQPEPAEASLLLARAVRAFHDALSDSLPALPKLTSTVDSAAGLLAVHDPELASHAHTRLRSLLHRLTHTTGLHGQPHAGNVLWTDSGPLLIDFEAACAGPPEWDLAYLDAYGDVFPECDPVVVDQLRAGVSFCVAAWCLAQPGRAPAVDEAARYHLAALRGSWLAASPP
jgi:Phosphotransferase enzyme family